MLPRGLFPTYVGGEHFLAIDGNVERYGGDDFALPEDALADVGEMWEHLQQMAAEVPLDEPWRAENAESWDAQTVDAWLGASAKTEVGLRYWRTMVPGLFSAEAAEMSLLHFLFHCRSGGTLERLAATHGGAQESRLEGGSQLLAMRLAERLGDAVRLSSPVSAIRQDSGSVEVTHDGGGVEAGRVIVALPPTLAGRIRYSPALPPLRDQLTQQVPMGYVTKVQITYPEPFWRAEGLSGSVLSLDDEVSIMFDNSPPDLSCGVVLGFLEGRHGRRTGELPPKERRELVLSVFAKFFGPAPRTPRSMSRETGRPRSGAEAATAGASGPACGRATVRRCVSPLAVSTGLVRRPQRSGTGIWTERYAPADAQPKKCSPLEKRIARDMREVQRLPDPRGRSRGQGARGYWERLHLHHAQVRIHNDHQRGIEWRRTRYPLEELKDSVI